MALDLNEYIKMSYERPNRKVLEGLGASEDLIEYLMETPGNTNWNILNSFGSGEGGDTEVWLVGDTPITQMEMAIFVLQNVDATDHMTELFTNAENYDVYVNGMALPYLQKDGAYADWTDTQSFADQTIMLTIVNSDPIAAQVSYKDASTAPTSVEVSVKAK